MSVINTLTGGGLVSVQKSIETTAKNLAEEKKSEIKNCRSQDAKVNVPVTVFAGAPLRPKLTKEAKVDYATSEAEDIQKQTEFIRKADDAQSLNIA